MILALLILLLVATFLMFLIFKRDETWKTKGINILFFLVWTAFTVVLTLCIFKFLLKPSVEVKLNTKSWNEIFQKEK
jgi:hypothetical protein